MKGSSHECFASEAAMCATFIELVGEIGGWRCYPETANFDLVLVREADGFQVGVEAKLSLNAKVVCQALPGLSPWGADRAGPDCRAVLVPSHKAGAELTSVCAHLGIVVIELRPPDPYVRRPSYRFTPELPRTSKDAYWGASEWPEWPTGGRLKLPPYMPDVAAGASGPVKLTDWKIRALKLECLLEERPVGAADFKMLGLATSRWTAPGVGWLVKAPGGGWVKGPRYAGFGAQHPRVFAEIKADRPTWEPAHRSFGPSGRKPGFSVGEVA